MDRGAHHGALLRAVTDGCSAPHLHHPSREPVGVVESLDSGSVVTGVQLGTMVVLGALSARKWCPGLPPDDGTPGTCASGGDFDDLDAAAEPSKVVRGLLRCRRGDGTGSGIR